LGDGARDLAPTPGSPIRPPTAVRGIAAGDVDADGKQDLVFGAAAGDELVRLLGDGQGGFRRPEGWRLKAGKLPNYVALGHLDGDGRPDLVAGNYGGGSVTVLLNTIAK
jgi:hypothetical protein